MTATYSSRGRKSPRRRGLGRAIESRYAEYAVIPVAHAIPSKAELGFDVDGALPEMLQNVHGALTTGLQFQTDQCVLIHGGTSTVGLTPIAITHRLGATVITAGRHPDPFGLLTDVGLTTPWSRTTPSRTLSAIEPAGFDAIA